jgi:hypothetical protein
MATKKAEKTSGTRSKAENQSKRGGARAGAGRKPKPITTLTAVLKTPAGTTDGAILNAKGAAAFALALFEETMRDTGKGIALRLDCARELLDRTIGKPRVANEPPAASLGEESGGVHIYIPANGREPQAEAC